MRHALAVLIWLPVGCVMPAAEDDAAPIDERPEPVFLVDGDLERLPLLDTGWMRDRCFSQAPLGAASWGVHAESFNRTDAGHTLENMQFRVFDEGDPAEPDGVNRRGLIAGKESRGTRMGYARFVQGDAWGGTHCGPISWNVPAPLPSFGRRLALRADLKNLEGRLFSSRPFPGIPGDSHVMMAFNVWLRSPDMPAGPDGQPKRMVMDLAVLHRCNWTFGKACGPNPNPGGDTFHYIVRIGPDSPENQWTRWTIDLSRHIDAAVDMFALGEQVRSTLEITQVELLVEVMDGQGLAAIDNVLLVELPPSWPAITDTWAPLPLAGDDPVPIEAP